MFMNILVMDAYINLASAIVLQAYKDLEIYEAENTENKKNTFRVPESEKSSAEWFIQSKEKDYLIKMITWWKKLRDEMGEIV